MLKGAPNNTTAADVSFDDITGGTNTVAAMLVGNGASLAPTGTGTVSATTLATPRAIYGNNFDGSAALTQVIGSTYGGTGNGFAKLSGPASSEKTFTLPNASATILTTNTAVTVAQGGTGGTTLAAALSGLGIPGLTIFSPVAFDYGSTSAIQLGTSPAGARFVPLGAILTVDVVSGLTLGSATFGMGQNSPNYSDVLFFTLAAGFTAVNQTIVVFTIAATNFINLPASTALFGKMTTAAAAGTLTGKVQAFGISGF